MCFVSDLRDSSIVYYRCLMALEKVFWGRKGVQWFFQPPPFNTVTVKSVFKKQKKKNMDILYTICYICLTSNVHVSGWCSLFVKL